LNLRPPGIASRRSPSCVVRSRPLARRTRTWGDTAQKNSSLDCFLSLTQRAPLVVLITRLSPHAYYLHSKKRKTAALGDCFPFLVAGAGFEPTTSGYRFAPVAVVCRPLSPLGSAHSHLGRHRSEKQFTGLFFFR